MYTVKDPNGYDFERSDGVPNLGHIEIGKIRTAFKVKRKFTTCIPCPCGRCDYMELSNPEKRCTKVILPKELINYPELSGDRL